jgi:hypothetical protein
MDLNCQTACDHKVGNPEVQYTSSTCPRCLGNDIYGGLSFEPSGKLSTLSYSDQLAQQIKKILTEKRRLSGYGFDYSLLSGVIDNSKLSAIYAEVARCILYLQSNQQQEVKAGHVYAGSEQIQALSSLKVEQSTTQPQEVQVYATVQTVSGALVSLQTTLQR